MRAASTRRLRRKRRSSSLSTPLSNFLSCEELERIFAGLQRLLGQRQLPAIGPQAWYWLATAATRLMCGDLRASSEGQTWAAAASLQRANTAEQVQLVNRHGHPPVAGGEASAKALDGRLPLMRRSMSGSDRRFGSGTPRAVARC